MDHQAKRLVKRQIKTYKYLQNKDLAHMAPRHQVYKDLSVRLFQVQLEFLTQLHPGKLKVLVHILQSMVAQ